MYVFMYVYISMLVRDRIELKEFGRLISTYRSKRSNRTGPSCLWSE